MAEDFSLSTDQLAALVELHQRGSLREAAESLFISEQGVRNRLLALEKQLGVELYRKRRGVRRQSPLTADGERLLPSARELLVRAHELGDLFRSERGPQVIQLVASGYLIAYILIDVVKKFHRKFPHIRVRLAARTEEEIEATLAESPEFSLGVAAPYTSHPDLAYRHLFSRDWSLITPPGHPLSKKKNLKLADLRDEHLIVYERGSTGRQHVMEAFQLQNVLPRVELEATTTDLIVRMVEAGLGVALVPLYHTGAVTRGRKVAARSLGGQIRPIHSGVLLRKGEKVSPAVQAFLEFLGLEE
jgi:DNA-binding transcriptional LysR family regulator